MESHNDNENQEKRTESQEEIKLEDENMSKSQQIMMEKSWPMARLEDISMTTSVGSVLGEVIQFLFSDIDSKVKPTFIKVCNPVIREETITKYIVYTIKGSDSKGNFEIFRRYSAFHALRTLLLDRWPGLYIPPLPGKKMIGNLSPDFIEDRRKYLEVFLNICTKIPYLYYSEEMQFFLRSQVLDAKAGLFALPKLSYEEIIQRYTTAFNHLSGKELSKQVLEKIESFGVFLRKIKASFEMYKTVAKGLVAAKRDYYDRLVSFHKNVLVDYEKTCVTEYSAGKPPYIFNAESNVYLNAQIGQVIETSRKESFDAFSNLLRHENKEIDAFLEALEIRRKYLAIKAKLQAKVQSDMAEMMKISSGKSTIKTVFSSKPKEHHVSEYETIIALNNKHIENISLLYDMITLILAYVEIDKFKANKIETYINVTKQMAYYEQITNLEASNFWANVLKTDILQVEGQKIEEQKAEDLEKDKENGP